MKASMILLLVFCLTICQTLPAQTYAEWFRQKKTQKRYLELQIAKLQVYAELVKKGYGLVNDGLQLYGDIRSGDWRQHLGFVDHQRAVSNAVRDYPKVAAIRLIARQIMQSYEQLYPRIRAAPLLKQQAADITAVMDQLLALMIVEVGQLDRLLASGPLSMPDEQRLAGIDRIYDKVLATSLTWQSLANSAGLLDAIRSSEAADIRRLQRLRR